MRLPPLSVLRADTPAFAAALRYWPEAIRA